jgi:hypothetical protein
VQKKGLQKESESQLREKDLAKHLKPQKGKAKLKAKLIQPLHQKG